MSNIIQTFPKGGSPTYAGLPDKPTVNNIDIEALSIEGMDVIEDTTNNVTEISAPGLNADSMADVLSGEIGNNFATNAFNYSTNEQIVGKWIDGKPIYQKTFILNPSMTISNSEWVSIGIAMPENGAAVLDAKGLMGTNNYSFRPIDAKFNAGDGYIMARAIGSVSYSLSILTLQYTKTTDT